MTNRPSPFPPSRLREALRLLGVVVAGLFCVVALYAATSDYIYLTGGFR